MSTNGSLPDHQVMALPPVDALAPTLFFKGSPLLTPAFPELRNGSRCSSSKAQAPSSQNPIPQRHPELQRSQEPKKLPPFPPPLRVIPWDGGQGGSVTGAAQKDRIWGFVCCE